MHPSSVQSHLFTRVWKFAIGHRLVEEDVKLDANLSEIFLKQVVSVIDMSVDGKKFTDILSRCFLNVVSYLMQSSSCRILRVIHRLFVSTESLCE